MMKQSTSFAQVATNLLNVLQGYTKGIRLLLVMLLTLTVSANAWAEEGEATITFSDAELSNQQSVNGTSFALGDYFTVTYAKNESSTNPTYYTSGTAIRCYVNKSTSNGNTITINQTENGKGVNAYITSVTYSGTNKQGTTSFAYSGTPTSSSNYSVTYSDACKVTSVVATLKETGGSKNGHFYSTGITITYTYTAGGGDPADPYTVTLVPGSGSVTYTELEEPNAGDGVTLPTPTLSSACQSEGWSFAGWATASVDTETETEPTLIAAGAYSPTSDITLYAVYQRTETTSGDEGGETGSVTMQYTGSTTNMSEGNNAETVGLDANEWSVVPTKGSANNMPGLNKDGDIRLYGHASDGNYLTISSKSYTITNVTITYTSESYNNGKFYVNGNETDASNINANEFVIKNANSGTTQVRIKSLVINYTSSGGGSSSTTYYHSTPDCGSTEPSICLVQKVVVH